MSRDPKHDLPPGIPAPGSLFAGKCRVERVLGVGGMGAVLAATHLHLKQKVAIKVMLPHLARQPEVVERFLREGRASVRIRSPHVARVLDVATLDTGEPYMLMELLEGSDLGRLLELNGPCAVREAVDLVLDACDALAEAHRKNIVHRDLKPANLFLAVQEDGREILKVLDFGISKLGEGHDAEGGGLSITKSRSMLGSPLYMSPEQLRGSRDVDARADIWSLGVILYELVAGKPPFDADTVAELGALVLAGAAPRLKSDRQEIPEAFVAVIDKCLQKDRDARYASVIDLAEALAPFASADHAEHAMRLRSVVEIARPDLTRVGTPSRSAIGDQPTLPARTGGSWSTTGASATPRSRRLILLAFAVAGVAVSASFVVFRREPAVAGPPLTPSSPVAASAPALPSAMVAPSADAAATEPATTSAAPATSVQNTNTAAAHGGVADAASSAASNVGKRPLRVRPPTPSKPPSVSSSPLPTPPKPPSSDRFE